MRDHALESEWCRQVSRRAGLIGHADEFAAAVFRRLEKGAREYGETGYLERPLEELLGEPHEEAEDTVAWSILIAERLYSDERNGRIDSESAQLIRLHLHEACAKAVSAWVDLRQAIDLLGDAKLTRPKAPAQPVGCGGDEPV